MPYELKLLPDEPIVLITLLNSDIARELPYLYEETANLVKNISGTVYRIVDLSQAGLIFRDVVQILAEGTKKRDGSVRDAHMHTVYVTGEDKQAKLLAESVKQQQYGGNNVEIFPTVNAALTYVRSNL